MSFLTHPQLLSIAEKYGTPVYVYDGNRIIDNYQRFVRSFNVPHMRVHYACKALTNLAILKLFKQLGAGLDCVSIQEARLGMQTGFRPDDIVFTPNNASEEEFREAVELGLVINVDNLHILEFFGINYPEYPVGIRINPHLMAGGNRKIAVGHIDSKFGISIHQLPLVRRLVDRLNIKINGIHVHTGSEIIDSDIFIKAADLIFQAADGFDHLEYIDFGSGFKIPYHKNDLYTDIDAFGPVFSERFNAYCEKAGKQYELKFEPGKYMVSSAGSFLASTTVIKQTTACTFVGLNSGFNHLIRPMFYESYHEITNLSNPDGDKKLYTVVGNICETDTFGSNRILREVRKNDVLLFENAGAYCFAMASQYNSRYLPPEVLVLDGQDYLIRKRETMDDLVRNQVMPTIPRWSKNPVQ